ncbi:nitroreductase family deazaflavin-dependent oxidoreductase [Nitriliruptoraceae bacterium ZYF776]|nr:nitroreductase family deazaflavin-dependent oxidoreductase [Profundirhabdus halotolerans]
MGSTANRTPRVPPRWFVLLAWRLHRLLHRLSGGRFLWRPSDRRGWGALRLTTVGRRSGQPRTVIVGYLEDGDDLVTLAMNGWGEGEPAWWLNLQAHPEATVRLAGERGLRPVRARRAVGDEHARLWHRWQAVEDVDGYSARRTTETAIVILAPRETAAGS